MSSRPDTKLTSRLAALGVIMAFAVAVPLSIDQLHNARQAGLRPVELKADWIRTRVKSSGGCYRREFNISGTVRHAWIAIAAREGFEVTINGNPVVRHTLWRPTRPFQNGMSSKGQRIIPTTTALGLNFPREYQWSGHENFRIPIFADVRQYLRSGPNVICVEIESRSTPASFCMEGSVELLGQQKVSLTTNREWQAEVVPPGVQYADWREPDYNARDWKLAEIAAPPTGNQFAQFDRRMFSQPFLASWQQHPAVTNDDRITFKTTWKLDREPQDATLRLATNRYYQFRVNGNMVQPMVRDTGLDSGDWLLSSRRGLDTPAKPELLDPDEVGSLFQGSRFESPRHGDPTADALRHKENVLNVTRDKARETTRSAMPGTYDPKRTLEETRRTPDKPYAFIDPVTPKSLTRDRSQPAFHSWDIANLLHAGENEIKVEVLPPISSTSFGWPSRIAVDGFAIDAAGSKSKLGGNWICAQRSGVWKNAQVVGQALRPGLPFPALDFRGRAKRSIASTSLIWTIMLLVIFAVGVFSGTTLEARLGRIATTMLGPTVVLLTALTLRWSFAERHEVIWFMQPITWWCIWIVAILTSVLPSVLTRLARRTPSARFCCSENATTIEPEWQAIAWRFAVLWILLLSFFLRVYKLEFQPLDDDEYASTQAVLAILETGAPQFASEDVWYTRSPFFHYSTALVARVFGPNLFTLRMWCALFGTATVWLTWHIGRTLLRSKWIGLAGMFLIAVHPFEIYTSHIIRFYQMQQFFALLTVYCFCRGFVVDQSQRFRYSTVFCFLLTVLSQEISVVMGLPLAVVAVLFGRDESWKANLRFLGACAVAVIVIGIDYIVFQTRCLTRTEGVSYTMEAAVKPHFWFVENFFSLFIGYSSLHLSLSLGFFAGLPLMFRHRDRDRTSIALVIILLGSIVLTNLLVTGVSLRYQYWMIPLWILCSLSATRLVIESIARLLAESSRATDGDPEQIRLIARRSLACIAIATVLLSWSLWRVPGSYESKLLGDSTGAFRFVRSRLQPGDRVAATEPHTHAALLETGRVDYDLAVPLLYDFLMLKDGHLIDRNGGARSVSSLKQLMNVCRDNDRVWVVVNREKFRSRSKNLRWEYPSARVELFLRKNMELKHRTYLWSVFLWDASRGFRQSFRAGSD